MNGHARLCAFGVFGERLYFDIIDRWINHGASLEMRRSTQTDWLIFDFIIAGERPEDKARLLQRQGVQEAHHAQGHTVQDRKGFPLCSG